MRRGRPRNLKLVPKLERAAVLVQKGKSYTEAAKALRLPLTSVYQHCKGKGIESSHHQGPKPSPKWDKVDWSKTNRQLAEELGVSYERVRQIRVRKNERAL